MKKPSNFAKRSLYNSRIVDTYVKLIKRKYSYVNVEELLHYAKMEPYEVADQGHWFTQDQIDLFHEKLSQMTQNRNIAREAGRYAASPEAIGVMRQYFLGLVGLVKAYEMIEKGAKNFTRSTVLKCKKITSNKVEITVEQKKGVVEKPYQCENRMGFIEAIAMGFTNRLPKVEHPECVFKGGKSCRYIISWKKTVSALLKKIRNYTALFLLFPWLVLSFVYSFSSMAVFFFVSFSVVFLLSFIAENREKAEYKSSLNNLKDSTDQLVDQININYNNSRMTNEIGQAISKYTKTEDVLSNIVRLSKKRLNYDRCLILLSDSEKKRLYFKTGFGYSEYLVKLLKKTSFHLDKPESKGAFVVAFKDKRSILINNINEIKNDLSLQSLSFVNKVGVQSFICCPIISSGESIGILAVDNLKSKKPLVQSDVSLLQGLASVLGISILNARLIETSEKQFRSIIRALVASIDARDPMTAGHSEKVTEYCLGICDELGLSRDYRKMIGVAAMLHDYGKIGVPDKILKKPERLNKIEFEIVKTHAEKTRRILEQMNFEGIFSQVPEIAGLHHEKLDGSGYPNGLKGDEIPLGAKIIAVADFFEAVTSRRHYRDSIPLKKAFEMLNKERGRRLDEKVVDAFTCYYAMTHAGKPEYRALSM